jgi:hypothetical protein
MALPDHQLFSNELLFQLLSVVTLLRKVTNLIAFRLSSYYLAQSGTGKTATFSIGVLQNLDPQSNEPQALVLSPTRELAQQIQKVHCM